MAETKVQNEMKEQNEKQDQDQNRKNEESKSQSGDQKDRNDQNGQKELKELKDQKDEKDHKEEKHQKNLNESIKEDLHSNDSKKGSEQSLTETVMERKENFLSDQSLCNNDQARKATSETNLSEKKEALDNRDSSSSGSTQHSNLETPPQRRLNKLRDHTSTVFPAGCMGCAEDPPSDQILSPRRFLDANEANREHAGLIDNTPKKRPSSAKPLPFFRNPLTGAGIDVEEVKRSTRRRGGNPVSGEGYEECDIKPNPNPSNSRIPPGGYSKGLW